MTIQARHEGNDFKIKTDGNAGVRLKRCGHMSCERRKGGAGLCCCCTEPRPITKKYRCNTCRKKPCPKKKP